AVSPQDTLAHARNLMVRHKISRVLVMDAGTLTGILTKKDIGYRQQQGAAWRRRSADQITVAEYATSHPVCVAPGTLAKAIAGIFMEKNIGGVRVVDNGTVTGIVTKSDLMKSVLVTGLQGTVQDVMEDAETVNRWHSLAGIITETNLAFHDEDRRRSGGILYEEPGKRHEHTGAGSAPDAPGNIPVTAGDMMTSPAITIAPVSTLQLAIGLMHSEQVNNLVVVEHNTLVGILKRDDIIKEVAK